MKVAYCKPCDYATCSPARCSPRRFAGNFRVHDSPLRGFEEDELAESFKELIDLENCLERAKENLSLRPDFTVQDAFRIFDVTGFGKVGTVDIKDAFASFGVFITLEEARLIMSRYDRDRDEVLRFDEFADMWAPIDSLTGSSLSSRSCRFPHGYYITPDILDPITRDDFMKVLRLTVDVENEAERIRQKHSMRPLFNRTDAFDALNRFKSNFITKEDFSALLGKHFV